MLLGRNPASGRQLIDGRGSAVRADHLGRGGAKLSAHGPDDELLSIPQAASLLSVSPQYLRKVVAQTQAARREADPPEPGQGLPALDHPYLDATRDGPNGHWSLTRGEVKRFAEARRAPTAVIGYDLTFSVPKSVSLLWARADPSRQAAIVAAVEDAVTAGMAYLEEHAAFVRTGANAKVQPASGLLAASYLHGTSRALDPQLHAHVVVANMAEGPDGVVRALDGRALFAHAKTASYLAVAELRLQMSRRLGVEWTPAERGLADVAGVPRVAIVEMSKRSRELEEYPEDKAELVARRRQQGAEMTEVRLASVEYAAGRISEAVERLRRDDRVVEADSPDDLLDALVADWYVDRLHRRANPELPQSSMMADHHVERQELNARARALLVADGTLSGPVVEVAGQCFQVGDEVVAMEQNRLLRPRRPGPGNFVHNGERGRVVEVHPGEAPVVVVDFERRGRVDIAERYLAKQVRAGVVGQIGHAYAVTSHMAQGETYQAGRHLSTDASSREGVYVGLTRGRGDARLYMVRQRELVPQLDAHAGLPRLDDEVTTLEAATRRLETQRSERLAREVDTDAADVVRLRRSMTWPSSPTWP